MNPTFPLLATALALVLACAPARATETGAPPQGPAPAGQPPGSMEFRMMEGRSAVGLSRWIQASGRITPDTASLFAAFAARQSVEGLTVVLDSGGGSLPGALALGRAFRSAGVNTLVGRALLPIAGERAVATLSTASAECLTTCPYAFLGGRQRYVTRDALLWLGQFDRIDGPDGGPLRGAPTLEEFEETQVLATRLAVYVQEMGVDLRMLELAAVWAWGSGEFHGVTQAELLDLRIGSQIDFAEADVEPTPWSMSARPDDVLLYRRVAIRPAAADHRVDAEVFLSCASEERVRLVARFILAAAPEQMRGFTRLRVNISDRYLQLVPADGEEHFVIDLNQARFVTASPEVALLVEAAERQDLSVQGEELETHDLSAGFAEALARLLSACAAQRQPAAGQQ